MARIEVPIVVDVDAIKTYLEQNDIVEVVRCRDCIDWIEDNPKIHYGHCANMYVCIYGYDYCSYGERREE